MATESRPARVRLQLTWPDKDKRLLSHGNAAYEWVEPQDWRVAEVRLLHMIAEYGDDPGENLLIEGDALYALTALGQLPEYRDRYLGKVKLAYLDPPFNTGQAFTHYNDALEHSIWLTMIRDRLKQIKELLSPDGSVWLHLDDAEVHRARCVMDEVFGADCFVGTVIWKKADTLRNDARKFSVSHDYLLAYSKNPDWRAKRLPRTPAMDSIYINRDKDPRGPWLAGTLISPHYRASGDYAVVTPSGAEHRAPVGTSWRVPRDTFQRLLDEDRIWFGVSGSGSPQQKLFLSEAKDRVVDTLWDVKEVGGNRQSKAEIKRIFPDISPFETPKPELLIQRILLVSTDPGETVLDCFAGSGTTAAVAHKMGRKWVAVELQASTVDDFILPRMQKVISGEDRGGISETVVEHEDGDLPEGVDPKQARDAGRALKALHEAGVLDGIEGIDDKAVAEVGKRIRAAARVRKETISNWDGGGGFTHLRVGPSMFEDADGVVVMADWATAGALAEAVAAQMRFPYAPEGLFVGRKNRTRLAVIDGVLTCSLVDILLDSSMPDEPLVVVAQALEPGSGEYLRAKRKGSRARKVPRDLAHISNQSVKVTAAPRGN